MNYLKPKPDLKTEGLLKFSKALDLLTESVLFGQIHKQPMVETVMERHLI